MNRVKMGVIGLGWFGVKHCEALAAIPQVELAAVCTRTESRLAEVANSFDVWSTSVAAPMARNPIGGPRSWGMFLIGPSF